MVHLEEVTSPVDQQGKSQPQIVELIAEDDDDDQYEDEVDETESVQSARSTVSKKQLATTGIKPDSNQNDEFDETVLQRIAALIDMVPPVARAKIYKSLATTWEYSWALTRAAGSVAWVVTTASLLVFLPIGLEIEREQFVIAQENQQRMQQQQAQKAVEVSS